MMEHVKIGAERAGKKAEDVEIVNRAMVLVTDDKAGGRDLFRAAFAPYYATPVYNNFLAWAGYQDVANVITEGWAAKDRAKTTGAISDELVGRNRPSSDLRKNAKTASGNARPAASTPISSRPWRQRPRMRSAHSTPSRRTRSLFKDG